MFQERYIGGPLDGTLRYVELATLDAERSVDRASGASYIRAPHLDTPEVRAWVVDEDPAGQQRHIVAEDPKGLTLGEIRGFIALADREGWPDSHRPKALAGFRAKLLKLELRHRRPR